MLELKNPHSVLAALEMRAGDVIEVRFGERSPHGAWQEVADLARSLGVPVRTGRMVQAAGGRRRRDKRGDKDRSGGRTAAAMASVRERSDVGLEQLLSTAGGDGHGIWLALDRLQDPHNIGAIFRTAAFFGVRGVLLTTDQSAPISSSAYDVASGGLEHVPFTRASNLARALRQARDAGLWVMGTSERGEQELSEADRDWLVVIGSEERGLRRLTLEHCDVVCRLSPRGQIASLNASVAAAVVLAVLNPS
ncbi:MAG TPA: 23S rRNA (guanosine(2251)-2'-O)-methyltransferase RlmB [Planctomycetaceae bacterium]|nr:23S rRNA (guanosine(2251)-2'-O)-methyltransferase RlmB [Planctomycetaceae bacterium]HCC99112.1 23S rRNA (guanosine(2251)-2'-O)-methyltransferase RlmB [Planctomycetaceae bacterium]|tara:strand:- start:1756 stop:2505 length:750 start_codon:yes stop_codon:yes gene_type:complete